MADNVLVVNEYDADKRTNNVKEIPLSFDYEEQNDESDEEFDDDEWETVREKFIQQSIYSSSYTFPINICVRNILICIKFQNNDIDEIHKNLKDMEYSLSILLYKNDYVLLFKYDFNRLHMKFFGNNKKHYIYEIPFFYNGKYNINNNKIRIVVLRLIEIKDIYIKFKKKIYKGEEKNNIYRFPIRYDFSLTVVYYRIIPKYILIFSNSKINVTNINFNLIIYSNFECKEISNSVFFERLIYAFMKENIIKRTHLETNDENIKKYSDKHLILFVIKIPPNIITYNDVIIIDDIKFNNDSINMYECMLI